MGTCLLTSREVMNLFDATEFLEELQSALIRHAQGYIVHPLPRKLMLQELGVEIAAVGDAIVDDQPALVPMTAIDLQSGMYCVKVLADRPNNRAIRLPAQRSTIALYSSETAECLGIIDGYALTQLRTCAMTVLATQTLAMSQSHTLGIIGTGMLAIAHARMMCKQMTFDRVLLWGRNREHAEQAVRSLYSAFREDEINGVTITILCTPSEVCAQSDVVCTLTPGSESILDESMLHPGLHINAVGSAPRPRYREIAPEVMRICRVFTDDAKIALQESGNLAQCDPLPHVTELSQVLAGKEIGRTCSSEITLFNSIGIACEDLAAGHYLLRKAAEHGRSVTIELR